MSNPIRCRSAFVSDVHLGATGSKVGLFQDFLYKVECENLFLVGDIIDGWVTREKRWTQDHTNVLRTILGKAKRGCRVCYTPGNHDAFMRGLNGMELGFIEFEHEFVHTTADNREILVVHGDFFDPTCRKRSWGAWVGAWFYEYLQIANAKVNKRRKGKKRPIDFASPIKRMVKGLIRKRSAYEELLIDYAREHGFEGVICGHVHRPTMETFHDGFVYGNTGDWVEHHTAILEHFDGSLELITWDVPRVEAESPERRSRRARLKALRALRSEVN